MTEQTSEYLLSVLSNALRNSPDPDSALVHLNHLFRSCGDPRWLADYLMANPAIFEALLIVLGGSDFAARNFALYPEYLDLLFNRQHLYRLKSVNDFLYEVGEIFQPLSSPAEKLDALRHFRRRETVRLISADLLGLLDLNQVISQLSALAEAVISATFLILPTEPNCRFLIVAFGKLGANELNYSSDIDLAFLHDGDAVEAERSARRIVKALSEATDYGKLYRIDLRLRPYGSAAPLSLSFDSGLYYYEAWSDPSERLALIKARAICGDEDLANRFERFRTSFVFSNPLGAEELAWLLRLKTRSESRFSSITTSNRQSFIDSPVFSVKHGIGGIRDVEVTVQLLQLTFADRFPDLTVRDTLTLLERLQRHDLISNDEAKVLCDGYKFLRRLEHLLQIAEDLPMQTLPTSEKELNRLARCMGFSEKEAMMNAFHHHTQMVRHVYENVSSKLAKTVGISEQTAVSIAIASGLDVTEDKLLAFGFTRPGEAYKSLHRLVHGQNTEMLPWRDRVRIMRILPILLDAVTRTPDPNIALVRLETLLSSMGTRHSTLESLCSNPTALRGLALMASVSEPFCELIVRHPERLESLLSDNAPSDFIGINFHLPSQRQSDLANYLRRYKGGVELQVGFSYICGFAETEQVSKSLSSLADKIVSFALRSINSIGCPSIVVFGLGGWGSEELHFSSDLDVVFAHTGQQDESEQTVLKLKFLLSDLTEEGLAYRLDFRLRPTGKEGALSNDAKAWQAFTEDRFEPWMALSWTRLRFSSGDQNLGQLVSQLVQHRIYEKGLNETEWDEFHRLCHRIQNEHRPPKGIVDIKHSEGALWDIELTVAEEQLRSGRSNPLLRTSSVLTALRVKATQDPKWFRLLKAYLWLRKIRLWLSCISAHQPPRFVFGDAIESLLAWLDINRQPIFQPTLIAPDDAIEQFRDKWHTLSANI